MASLFLLLSGNLVVGLGRVNGEIPAASAGMTEGVAGVTEMARVAIASLLSLLSGNLVAGLGRVNGEIPAASAGMTERGAGVTEGRRVAMASLLSLLSGNLVTGLGRVNGEIPAASAGMTEGVAGVDGGAAGVAEMARVAMASLFPLLSGNLVVGLGRVNGEIPAASAGMTEGVAGVTERGAGMTGGGAGSDECVGATTKKWAASWVKLPTRRVALDRSWRALALS